MDALRELVNEAATLIRRRTPPSHWIHTSSTVSGVPKSACRWCSGAPAMDALPELVNDAATLIRRRTPSQPLLRGRGRTAPAVAPEPPRSLSLSSRCHPSCTGAIMDAPRSWRTRPIWSGSLRVRATGLWSRRRTMTRELIPGSPAWPGGKESGQQWSQLWQSGFRRSAC